LADSVSVHEKEKSRIFQLLEHERILWNRGLQFIAGVDEAGRGPLAGPVVAAAVIFPPNIFIPGIDDSKKIIHSRRVVLCQKIREEAVSFGIGIVSEKTIDRINILRASLEAMRLALEQLSVFPQHVLIDGSFVPDIPCEKTPIIKGDQKCYSIAAASIVAKVTRDEMMETYDRMYPHYGFAKHKGYGTRDHIKALKKHGWSPIHRRSFKVKGLQVS
jgi:ribonuclease HII